jgi:1-acyl-sn-glycerol-3-phosphate acyltransferase
MVMSVAVTTESLLRKSSSADMTARLWTRGILKICRVRVRTVGMDQLDLGQSYLFCSNHLSFLDPPLLTACLTWPIRILTKESLFKIPMFGRALRCFGNVPVNRDDPRKAVRSLHKCAEVLQAGASIVIFPEGTRSPNGNLQSFKSGAFQLGIDTAVPIVPVAIRGSWEALSPGSIAVRGGNVLVLVGEPILTKDLGRRDRELLADKTHAAIRSLLACEDEKVR